MSERWSGGQYSLYRSLLGMYLIPRPVADAGYDLVGRVRYRLAGRSAAACPVLPVSRGVIE